MSGSFNIYRSVAEWLSARGSIPANQRGFVPTMGALHAGHASLIAQSARENARTLVSIFVNPTQFDDPNDLAAYPRTEEADLALCRAAGATDILLPQAEELYADRYRYRISENDLSTRFCGAHRPGHFDGVLTVVMKLLQIADAHRAYFGEKDYQQLELVRGMAKTFFLQTQIIGCPIVRESDGLALSSRNVRLQTDERQRAPELHVAIQTASSALDAQTRLASQGFDVDYVEDFNQRRLAAVRIGKVRLIDNVQL